MRLPSKKLVSKNPAVAVFFTAAVILLLYVLMAHPFYIQMKKQSLIDAYKTILDLDLAMLAEEDEELLQTFRTDNLDCLITNDKFATIYVSSVYNVPEQIDRYIKSHVEEYQSEPVITVRSYKSLQVIRLRAAVTQNDQTFYVYIRREIRQVREIIFYTALYFILAGALALLAWYLLLRAKNVRLVFAGEQQEPENSVPMELQKNSIDEAQKEFVANISHELKTPLAVISGQVEMLQCMGDEIDREYYFASIREEIDKMTDMVGDLLDITIVDHNMGEMELGEVDLTDTMEYMILKYEALFRKNKIKLSTDIARNCMVKANRMYLEQAVNNYIMNAFQHTAQGRRMKISLTKEAEYARIVVYNDGANIPEEDVQHIWESFYKSARGERKNDSQISNAGLGLYMVKKIAEHHGGFCGVENREKGVEFWIQIPLTA